MQKKMGSLLFYGVLAVIVLGTISYRLADKAGMSVFGYRYYEVLSESMNPALRKGDLIIVKLISPEEAIPGDIVNITVSGEDLTLVHRVIEIYEENGNMLLVTKGDANQKNDPPVPADNIIGKMELRVPYLGLIFGFIRDYVIYILLIAVMSRFLFRVIRKTKRVSNIKSLVSSKRTGV